LKDEESMNPKFRSVAVFGAAVVLASVLATSQTSQSTKDKQAGGGAAASAQEGHAAASKIPADEQPTKEQLVKLFEVMRVREQMQSMMKMMPAMVQQQIKEQTKEMTSKLPGGRPLTAREQADIEKVVSRYMEKAMNIYPVEEMIDDIAVIYQHHISRTDVDAFITFYSSSAGQHLLNEQPAIMAEYMPMVMKRMDERTKELTAELMKDMATVAKESTPAEQPIEKKSTPK
jgi:uncharacterized protein